MTVSSEGATKLPPESPCPCGHDGKTFGACCLPLLRRERKAATAEELMRSRFTAHVVRDDAHIHRTHLETANKPYIRVGTGKEARATWTRLVIHSHEPGKKPDTARVEFTAYFLEGEEERPFQENAAFELVDGTWFYVRPVREGPAPVRSTAPKVGRNDPCPCGSGKKYKKCCA